jgi:cyclic pyranopterin phosphate synthase
MPRLPLVTDPPAAPPPAAGPLADTFGRVHTNLRVSVTDRCNLRCTYCMPEDVTFRDRSELLTFEEIAAFVRAVVPLGVSKVRLTGGEPLVRKDLHRLVRMIAETPGVTDLGLTTNSVLLADQAAALHAAGLRRLNVSLDTLDPDRFRRIARRDGLDRVLAGLAAAKAVGFGPIKVNAVAVRGLNDADVVPLARFCRGHGYELRFIEYMPIGAADWDRAELLPAADILAAISAGVAPLRPAADQDPHAPATEYEYADGGGRVGVIASVTRPFCGACDRLRLTADGKLRNCLFARDETDVRPLLRPAADEAAVRAAVRRSVWAKRAGHGIDGPAFVKPERTMHAIGG